MKKNIFILLLFIISVFTFFPDAAALENHTVTIQATIEGVTEEVDATFHYRLRSEGSNPDVPLGLPTEAEIRLQGNPINEKISATATLDFSKTVFTKVGTYVFTLIEDNSSNEKDYPHSTKEYKVYVDVRNVNGKIEIQALEQGLNTTKNQKEDILFEHSPIGSYIVVNTKLSGPNAIWNDKNVYFKYRVTIQGNPSKTYTILGQDEKVTFDGKSVTTVSSYTISGDGDLYVDRDAIKNPVITETNINYVDVYAKQGQTITIGYDGKKGQILIGTNYRIYKIDALKWDTHVDGKHVVASDIKSVDSNFANNVTVFVHSRDIDIPITGLFLDHWPILLLLAITILGILFIKRMKTE